ncbi:MAG: lysophospholipid acyltransferase family protein, partial [Gemmatimonadaceae bacterium]
RSSVVKAMADARTRIRKNASVMIFPEGTRSRDGELLPFKDGAFRLALEAGVPILPIVVAGTRNAMAKGTFRFQRARARVKVLPPIDTTGLTLDDIVEIRDRTRAIIADARRKLVSEMAAGQ